MDKHHQEMSYIIILIIFFDGPKWTLSTNKIINIINKIINIKGLFFYGPKKAQLLNSFPWWSENVSWCA